MTEHEQAALSAKYVPRQFAFVPVTDQLIAIFESYGSRRDLLCFLPPEEIGRYVTEDYQRQRELQVAAFQYDLSINLNIDFPEIDLEIDL